MAICGTVGVLGLLGEANAASDGCRSGGRRSLRRPSRSSRKPRSISPSFASRDAQVLPQRDDRAGGVSVSRTESHHRHRQAGGRCAGEGLQGRGLRRGIRRYPRTGSDRRHRAPEGHRGQARVRARPRRALLFRAARFSRRCRRSQTGATPSLPALQKQLAELNARTADRVVTPVLKAGSEPGTVDVDLDVKDTLPLHGFVSYDNRHTADTTPNRATAALELRQSLAAPGYGRPQYQTAPAKPSDAEVFIANYLAHMGSTDSEAAFTYTHTYSNVLALGTLGVLGKGSIYGAHWIKPLQNTPADAPELEPRRRLQRRAHLGAAERTAGRHRRHERRGRDRSGQVRQLVRRVLRQLDRAAASCTPRPRRRQLRRARRINSTDEFENARYNAYPDYFYLRAGFGATQPLPGGLAFQERLSAQWSDSPLVNNEQFSLGGVDTVRGYLEAETLGDSGAAGSLELHSPALGPHAGQLSEPAVRVRVRRWRRRDARRSAARRSARTSPCGATASGCGWRMRRDSPATLDYAMPRARRRAHAQRRSSHRLFVALRILDRESTHARSYPASASPL